MRLKRASAVSPSAWRSGVTASTTHRKRKVQSPVERSKASAGLAPSVFRMAPASSHANGSRHTRNTSGLAVRCSKRCCTAVIAWATSIELLEVHARVELAHLGFVAIEQLRLALLGEQAVFANAPLRGLAPARVRHVGVHIGIKAILVARRLVPGRARLLVGQADGDDALGALEAVLPRHDQPHGRAILVRSEEHTSELQSPCNLVCRLLLEKKK